MYIFETTREPNRSFSSPEVLRPPAGTITTTKRLPEFEVIGHVPSNLQVYDVSGRGPVVCERAPGRVTERRATKLEVLLARHYGTLRVVR